MLYANINAFKRDFDVIVYHLKKKNFENIKRFFSKKNIDSIFFLSKILTSAEIKYWPTKLKIMNFVWTVQRIAHLIKISNHTIVLYTNHEAIIKITNQTKLSFTNIDKQNLKLMKTSMYLSQFRLKIRHRFDKFNVISNVSNKFSMKKRNSKKKLDLKHYIEFLKNSKNDQTYIYVVTLMKMSKFFKNKIILEYFKKNIWPKIKKMIKNLKKRQKQTENEKFTKIIFRENNELIYHVKEKNRLCISTNCEKNVFELIHDWNNHVEHNRAYEKFVEFVYILKLNRKIKQYIKHCSACELNQIKKHAFYEKFVSIMTKMIFFKIIVIDFIVTLSRNESDSILTSICKIFKKISFIFEMITWIAK